MFDVLAEVPNLPTAVPAKPQRQRRRPPCPNRAEAGGQFAGREELTGGNRNRSEGSGNAGSRAATLASAGRARHLPTLPGRAEMRALFPELAFAEHRATLDASQAKEGTLIFANMSFADWMSVPILIITLAAAIAAVCAWLGITPQPKPKVHIRAEAMSRAPGWWRLTIDINNITPVRWGARQIEVLRPAGARIVNMRDADGRDALNGHRFDAAKAEAAASGVAALKMIAGVAGSYAPGGALDYRATQRVSEFVYFKPGQAAPLVAEFTVTLFSEELRQRISRERSSTLLNPPDDGR
jgi:hypothetical protein